MALANKDHTPSESTMAILQASAFYDHNLPISSSIHTSSSSDDIHALSHKKKTVHREPESPNNLKSGPAKNLMTPSNSSSVSSPSSTNSSGLGYHHANYSNLLEEGNSVIRFRPDYGGSFLHGGGSFFNFDSQNRSAPRNLYPKMIGEEDGYPLWLENQDLHGPKQLNSKCAGASHEPLQAYSCHHAAADYGSPVPGMGFMWLNDQELGKDEASGIKRPSPGENVKALKKQCAVGSSSSDSKKSKSNPGSTSKDPQSVAAKNRRERISERLKILQDLVPNGSKVDLVTMLEKAISYVKFLQLQVKVLATDEFWPAQGGKAPDLSQVREAIDAILASQRDRNSSSK